MVRPAAEGEDTAPQDVQHFPVAVGDRRSPNGRARSVWPNKGKGAFGLSKSPLRLDHAPARDLAILEGSPLVCVAADASRTRLTTS